MAENDNIYPWPIDKLENLKKYIENKYENIVTYEPRGNRYIFFLSNWQIGFTIVDHSWSEAKMIVDKLEDYHNRSTEIYECPICFEIPKNIYYMCEKCGFAMCNECKISIIKNNRSMICPACYKNDGNIKKDDLVLLEEEMKNENAYHSKLIGLNR